MFVKLVEEPIIRLIDSHVFMTDRHLLNSYFMIRPKSNCIFGFSTFDSTRAYCHTQVGPIDRSGHDLQFRSPYLWFLFCVFLPYSCVVVHSRRWEPPANQEHSLTAISLTTRQTARLGRTDMNPSHGSHYVMKAMV